MAIGFVLISTAPAKEHEVDNELLKVCGSGESRKIGGGLLGGGLVVGIFWIVAAGPMNLIGANITEVVVQSIVVLIAAIIGAAAAIGLFLLALMKSCAP